MHGEQGRRLLLRILKTLSKADLTYERLAQALALREQIEISRLLDRFVDKLPKDQRAALQLHSPPSRAEVRWAQLTGQGPGLRLEGRPHFAFTARPWTSEALAAGRHPPDLVPDSDWVWVNADAAQQGIGTASCGPGVLPQYRLEPRPVTLGLAFKPL